MITGSSIANSAPHVGIHPSNPEPKAKARWKSFWPLAATKSVRMVLSLRKVS